VSSRVTRNGNFAHKQFDRRTLDELPLVIQRSRLLSESGLRTPVAISNQDGNETVSPWIEGQTGSVYLIRLRSAGGLSRWSDLSEADQGRLLAPLVQLHNTSVINLELHPLDIWRRITPRLASDSGISVDGRSAEIDDMYRHLRDQQVAIEPLHHEHGVPVHGDYHVNQIIVARQDGEPWILDLDDMALGFPEIDLGNFIANLATNSDLLIDSVMEDYQTLKGMLCPIYVSLGGRVPDTRLIDFYAAVSLLRRFLKFFETGRCDPDPDEILRACRVLTCQLTIEGSTTDD